MSSDLKKDDTLNLQLIRGAAKPHEVYKEWKFAGKDASANDRKVVEKLWGKPRNWRFDFAIPSLRIAWEIDGGIWVAGRHTRGSGFSKDIDKLNTAAALGWHVVRSERNNGASRQKALEAIKLLLEWKSETSDINN